MSTTTIDDHDSAITYTGNWVSGGIPNEYGGTVTSSTHEGDKFTVAFTGTSIAVYATVDGTSGGVITSYSIDGGAAVQATAPQVNTDTYSQKLWSSPTLSSGKHTLDVAMVKVNEQGKGEGTVWFDSFLVTHGGGGGGGNDNSSTIASGTTVASVTDKAAQTKAGASSTSAKSSATTTPSTDSKNGSNDGKNAATNTKSNSHTGAIAGAVIAVVLAILALTALFLFLRHRKRKAKMGSPDNFEKFFNNPPHSGAAAQNSTSGQTPPAQNPSYPFAAAGAAGAGAMTMNNAPSPPSGPPYSNYTNVPTSSPPPSAHNHTFAAVGAASVSGSSHGRGPSLDATSVTSSNVIPPSKQFMYAHNSENVLTYGTPPIADAKGGPAQGTGPSGSSTLLTTTAAATPYDPDSISELKRRQQEAVANYNAGITQGTASYNEQQGGAPDMPVPQVVQHMDSGFRGPATVPAPGQPVELPPAYTIT